MVVFVAQGGGFPKTLKSTGEVKGVVVRPTKCNGLGMASVGATSQ